MRHTLLWVGSSLLLLACGGDCDRAAASAPAATAGAEAPASTPTDRTPQEERTRLLDIVSDSDTPALARASLEGERFADPAAEAARTTCLATLALPDAAADVPLARACAGLVEALTEVPASPPQEYDAVHRGTLTDEDPRVPDDDSPYDEMELRVPAGWTITASMESTDFDTYLWLIGPDGRSLVQDDDGGEATNSRIVSVAPSSGLYTVRANSYDGSGRGAYTLHITSSATAPPPAPVTPAPLGEDAPAP